MISSRTVKKSLAGLRSSEFATALAKKGGRRDALAVQTVSHLLNELATPVGWLRWCIFVHSSCVADRRWADDDHVRGKGVQPTGHNWLPLRMILGPSVAVLKCSCVLAAG